MPSYMLCCRDVAATLDVKEDLFVYKSGVYRYSAPPLPSTQTPPASGHHSVRIIGYATFITMYCMAFSHDCCSLMYTCSVYRP